MKSSVGNLVLPILLIIFVLDVCLVSGGEKNKLSGGDGKPKVDEPNGLDGKPKDGKTKIDEPKDSKPKPMGEDKPQKGKGPKKEDKPNGSKKGVNDDDEPKNSKHRTSRSAGEKKPKISFKLKNI